VVAEQVGFCISQRDTQADWLAELGRELGGPGTVCEARSCPGQGDVHVALVGRQGGEMFGDGVPVASGHWAGERVGWADIGDVSQTAEREVDERFERNLAGLRKTFDLTEERDKVIGRHYGSGVIEGTHLIGHREGASAQRVGEGVGANACDGHPRAYKPLGTDLCVRERYEWMKRTSSSMRLQRVEHERTGEVDDRARLDRLNTSRDGWNHSVRRGDDDGINARCGVSNVVVPMEIADGPTGAFERQTKRTASAPLTNDSDLHHR
jgi:hypothetical protein